MLNSELGASHIVAPNWSVRKMEHPDPYNRQYEVMIHNELRNSEFAIILFTPQEFTEFLEALKSIK